MQHSTITQRVEALRAWMRCHGLVAYIFPSTDPHSGEYVADHWHAREWISGFNGSAGTAVVTLHGAALWTDSRYWLAAEQQLEGTPFELVRCGRNVATAQELIEWIQGSMAAAPAAQAPDGNAASCATAVGVDAWTNSVECIEELTAAAEAAGMSLATQLDPTQELWEQRPPLPVDPVVVQPLQLAGRTAADKLADIRAELRAAGADALVVSLLDEIAWTLNLRGNDVHCTPLFVAYMLVLPHKAVLYIDPRKLDDQVYSHLAEAGVEVQPYAPFTLQGSMTVQYDPAQTNAGIMQALMQQTSADAATQLRFLRRPSPITPMKAIKNETEIAGFRRAMLRDGVAMVQFMASLTPADSRLATTPAWPDGVGEQGDAQLTEMEVDRRLTALRAMQPGFRGLSFDTIAAYGPHAAVVHYEATPETDIPLEPRGMLLLDSGAQYVDGTTDITRTIPLGPLTDEERFDYTLVLKGFLRLCMAVFPAGTTGTQLDVLARYAMWQHHKNYGHGTGHGVGSFLSVHEGPHQFRMNYMPAPLQAGMTVTVEPGIYIAGSHGCRTENTMLIVEDDATTATAQVAAHQSTAAAPQPTTTAHQDHAAALQPPTTAQQKPAAALQPPTTAQQEPAAAPQPTTTAQQEPAAARWLRLEPLTLCPIPTSPIIPGMLLPDEVAYLNAYHARVRRELSPLLTDPAHRRWLIANTEPITPA